MTDHRGPRVLGIGALGMRVIAAFLIVALATVLVDVLITTVTGTTEFDQFVRKQEMRAVQAAAANAGVAYEQGGWQHGALNPLIAGLERNGASLLVTDTDGGLVAISPRFSATQGMLSAPTPIYAAGHQVGSVILKFDRSSIADEAARLQAERWRWRYYAAGIAVLIALIVSVPVSRRITSPVDKVLSMLRARGAGDRDLRIGNVRAGLSASWPSAAASLSSSAASSRAAASP